MCIYFCILKYSYFYVRNRSGILLVRNTKILTNLLMQSNAFWNSCSARWYSSDKIWHCSRVTAIAVLSLALLQLVKVIPKNHLKYMRFNENTNSKGFLRSPETLYHRKNEPSFLLLKYIEKFKTKRFNN